MRKLNFVEIGKSGKHFNTNTKTPIDKLFMFNGFKANFVKLEKGYFLRVEPVKKFIQQQSALDVIQGIYKLKDLEKDLKREKVKEQLINKTVMSNYGKSRFYRINDIKFDPIQSI